GIFAVVAIGVALECRVSGKVELRDKCYVARSSHLVVNMLAHPPGIVAGHIRLKGVVAVLSSPELCAVVKASPVVLPGGVSLPDLEICGGKRIPSRIEDRTGHDERQTLVSRTAQRIHQWRVRLVERAQIVRRRGRQRARFSGLPQRECSCLTQRRSRDQEPGSETLAEDLSP